MTFETDPESALEPCGSSSADGVHPPLRISGELRGWSALVVDDAEINRILVSTSLKRRGFSSIYVAGDGVEALERMSEHLPDVIFTDFNMPNMNGGDFVAKVRSNPEHAHIPVVLLSSEDFTSEDWLGLGFTSYLRKPFTGTELNGAISRLGV